MHKNLILIFALIISAIGCANNQGKTQYYDKGVGFFESGNSNGAIIAFKKAIEADPNYFEARYQLAQVYIQQAKYESAERELQKVLKLNPSFNDAHLSLAKVYVHTGKADDAIKEVKQYMQEVDRNAEASEIAAIAHFIKKDYLRAEEMLVEAIDIAPSRLSSKIVLSDVYLAADKTDKAEKLINDILNGEKDNTKALYLLVKLKQKQKDSNGVIAAYERIIKAEPLNVNAYFELGIVYLQEKNIEKAGDIARKIKKENPKRPEGYYLTGLVLFQEKKVDAAIVSLQESLKNSSNPGAYYYLGLCHYLKGDLEQATSEFQRVVDIRPEMVQARLLLAVSHLKKGRAEESAREARYVIEKDEKNAFAHNLLGSAYMSLGEGDLAMEEFDRAIELNPGLVDAHIKKGAFNLLSGDNQQAEREFVNAVKVAPDMLNSRIILAQYYIKTRQFEKAIEILSEGLKENPNDAILYNIMGAAYLGSEHMDNAVKYFEKSIESNSKFFLPYFNLARVHLGTKNKDRAKAEYLRVLEVDPNNLPALLMMAKIMESEKKDAEALTYYKKAKALGKPVAYVELAGFYQRKNDMNGAVRVLDEALKTAPEDTNLLDMKGRVYFSLKDYKKALDVYQLMEKSSPELAKEKMAGIYAYTGDYDNAIKKLKEIVNKNPDRVEIMQKIAAIYMKKKDFRAAEASAKEVILRKPDSDGGYQLLAEIYIAEKHTQKAIDILKKAEQVNPDNIKTKVMKGKVYIASGDHQMAMNIFNELEAAYPKYAPVYYLQASTLELMGMKKTAIEKHEKALDLSPNYAPSLNNLAYLYSEGYGPIEKAELMAKKAKDIAPKDGSITDTLGWVLYKSGNYDDALKYFIEATHYLPGEPTIRYHLGLAYLNKEMAQKAEEQFENAVRLGRINSFAEIADAKRILEGMQ